MAPAESTVGRSVIGRRGAGVDEDDRRTSGRSKRSQNKQEQQPLARATVFVDARLDNGCSMDKEYGDALRKLGAAVRKNLPKKIETLTHLVWSGGSQVSAQRAVDAGVNLVDASWVFACQQDSCWAPEEQHYPKDFIHVPGLQASAVGNKKTAKKKGRPPEPVRNQWKDLDDDNFDLCFSSSQRDPVVLDDDLGLNGHNRSRANKEGGASSAVLPPPPGDSSKTNALQQRENPSGGSTPASSPVGDREEEVVEDDNSDDDDFDENDVEINVEITEALADDTETETVDGCDPGGRFRAETSEGILEVTTAAAATTSRKFPPPGRGSAKKRRGSGLSSPSRYLMSPFAGRQRMRGRSTGIGRASPAGYGGVFDVSEGGGSETENTILDSTDCDSKAGTGTAAAIASGRLSQTEFDLSSGSEGNSDTERGVSSRGRLTRLSRQQGNISVGKPDLGSPSPLGSKSRSASASGIRVSGKNYRDSAKAWLEANSRRPGIGTTNIGSGGEDGSCGGKDMETAETSPEGGWKPLPASASSSSSAAASGCVARRKSKSASTTRTYGSSTLGMVSTPPPVNGGAAWKNRGGAEMQVAGVRGAGFGGTDPLMNGISDGDENKAATPASGYAGDQSAGVGAGVFTKSRARTRQGEEGGDGGSGSWTCKQCTFDNGARRRRCFMCNSCPPEVPLPSKARTNSAEDGEAGGARACAGSSADSAKKDGTSPTEGGGKQRKGGCNAAVAGRRDEGQPAAASGASGVSSPVALTANDSACGEWDGYKLGGSTSSSSSLAKSAGRRSIGGNSSRLSLASRKARDRSTATVQEAVSQAETGGNGDAVEEEGGKRGEERGRKARQRRSPSTESGLIRKVAAGAVPDSVGAGGDTGVADGAGPSLAEDGGVRSGSRGGRSEGGKGAPSSPGEVGGAAVRLFAGKGGGFPRMPGFSLTEKTTRGQGGGRGGNRRVRREVAKHVEERNIEKGTDKQEADDEETESVDFLDDGARICEAEGREAFNGGPGGVPDEGKGAVGDDEPDTVSKRVERSGDGEEGNEDVRPGRRRANNSIARRSLRASVDAGTNSPDSLAEEEAQRAAALLVAMRPSSQADDADDAAKGLPRGGARRKDGRGRSAPAARASVLFSEKGGSPKRRGKAGARGRGGSRGGRASSRGGGARRQPGVPFFGGGGEMQATTSPPEKQVAALAASGAKSGGAAKKRKGISRFERGGSSSGAEKDVAGEKDTVPRARVAEIDASNGRKRRKTSAAGAAGVDVKATKDQQNGKVTKTHNKHNNNDIKEKEKKEAPPRERVSAADGGGKDCGSDSVAAGRRDSDTKKKKHEDKDKKGRKSAAGKRNKGDNGGGGNRRGGGADGGGGYGGRRPDELEGIVRVAFSGLTPADRQAAASMVRSLSKKRKNTPPGSSVCNSEGEAFTHLVIPDESRRTLKVLFALCAPPGPNGKPPAVVTVAWLYASLEAGYFVDTEAFRPARYRGTPSSLGNAGKNDGKPEGLHSISSRLLSGERVMVGGVADPPPDVVEKLARAAGAEITRSLREATVLLVGSEHELQEWVDGEKAAASAYHPSSKKNRAEGTVRGRGRNLAPSTASSRNASLFSRRVGGGDVKADGPAIPDEGFGGKGKKRGLAEVGAASGGGCWGQEEDDALCALKSADSVVRLQWFFDSVERGVAVDKGDFLVRSEEGAAGNETDLEDAGSQEW